MRRARLLLATLAALVVGMVALAAEDCEKLIFSIY
jgi:hypothetical protein